MASANSLVHQAGEYLAMAELTRRGYAAYLAPPGFPGHDIIVNDTGSARTCALEVKTKTRGGSWGSRNLMGKTARLLVAIELNSPSRQDGWNGQEFFQWVESPRFLVLPLRKAVERWRDGRFYFKVNDSIHYEGNWARAIGFARQTRADERPRFEAAARHWFAAGELCRLGTMTYVRSPLDPGVGECFFIDEHRRQVAVHVRQYTRTVDPTSVNSLPDEGFIVFAHFQRATRSSALGWIVSVKRLKHAIAGSSSAIGGPVDLINLRFRCRVPWYGKSIKVQPRHDIGASTSVWRSAKLGSY